MKKMIVSSLFATMLMVGVAAYADESTIVDQDATTKAKVGITAVSPEDKPGIIEEGDKQDPGDEKDPGSSGSEETGHTGQFTIDQVPNFGFGTTTVAGDTLKLDKTNNLPVQVSDRRSNGSGWKLSVQLGEFKNVDDSKKGKDASLQGVKMNMAIIGDLVPNAGNLNSAPTKHAIELKAGGGSADLLTAAADTDTETGIGRGSWMGKFADGTSETETTLTIPGGNYEGTYSADLVWKLSQTL